jgi:hypothetical protein
MAAGSGKSQQQSSHQNSFDLIKGLGRQQLYAFKHR